MDDSTWPDDGMTQSMYHREIHGVRSVAFYTWPVTRDADISIQLHTIYIFLLNPFSTERPIFLFPNLLVIRIVVVKWLSFSKIYVLAPILFTRRRHAISDADDMSLYGDDLGLRMTSPSNILIGGRWWMMICHCGRNTAHGCESISGLSQQSNAVASLGKGREGCDEQLGASQSLKHNAANYSFYTYRP